MVDATNKLRVLIVDDSALYRQTITAVLRGMDDVEIVGIAKNGQEAIAQIASLAPDVLTLDVEMPNLNGIETLREMNRQRCSAKAIMVSSLTEAGAKVTMDALFEGAFDFIQKPSGGLVQSRDLLRTALTEKLAAFRNYLANANAKSNLDSARKAIVRPLAKNGEETAGDAPPSGHCDLVVIGLSTGGPKAINHVLPRLDGEFPVPIIVVQHMPAEYTAMMANRLNETCELTVVEAKDEQPIVAGTIYLAPGGKHLNLIQSKGHVLASINQEPMVNSCRPAVDYTLGKAIDVYGSNILAVIMTGMGKDGVAACRRLHADGGTVFAQDAATSAVYGMPKAVIEAGIAERELPLGRIAPAIIRHVNRNVSTRK